MLRRVSARRICTIGVLAIVGSAVGGTSASADVENTPAAAIHATAGMVAHSAGHSPAAEPASPRQPASPSQQRDLDESTQARSVGPTVVAGERTSSARTSDDVVEELQTELTDPILMAVAPSPSHGLSFQEGDAQHPLPFDGFLGEQGAKAVLTGGSARTSKGKAVTSVSGADPHWVNQLCASRVNIAYGSPNTTRPQQGTALQRGCAHHKLLSRAPAPRRASASSEVGDAASSAAADDGEDDQPGSPLLRPMSVAAGQLFTWYVPASGTNSVAVRTVADEPSFSPD